MKKTDWKGTAELIGIAAIVGSLIFVGLQLQQDRQIARAQISTELDASAMELAQALRENSTLWRDGLDGNELSTDDNLIFLALVRAVEGSYRGRYVRLDALGTGDPQTIVQNYAYQLYQYPGLRRAFNRLENRSALRRNAFGRENIVGFRDAVMETLENLDETSPEMPEKDYLPVE